MIGKIFKYFFIAVALVVLSMLAFRFFAINNYPDDAKGVIRTEALANSYRAGTLKGKTWEISATHDNTGDFFVHQPIYFEKEKTLIITVRYNNSFLAEQKFEGDGSELPLFPSLYADGKERIFPSTYHYSYAFGIYSYRRYVFENIDISGYEHLYLDIHLDDNYFDAPHSSLDIYNTKSKIKDYKLTKIDKNRLK